MRNSIMRLFKKAACVMLVGAVCVQLISTTASAKTYHWNLVHSPSGTSYTNKVSWSAKVTTAKYTTTVYVNIRSGYPRIQAQTSNGIDKLFYGSGGATSVSTRPGQKITLKAHYAEYSDGYSAVEGYFEY